MTTDHYRCRNVSIQKTKLIRSSVTAIVRQIDVIANAAHNLTEVLKNNVYSNTLGEMSIEELDCLAKIFQAGSISEANMTKEQ